MPQNVSWHRSLVGHEMQDGWCDIKFHSGCGELDRTKCYPPLPKVVQKVAQVRHASVAKMFVYIESKPRRSLEALHRRGMKRKQKQWTKYSSRTCARTNVQHQWLINWWVWWHAHMQTSMVMDWCMWQADVASSVVAGLNFVIGWWLQWVCSNWWVVDVITWLMLLFINSLCNQLKCCIIGRWLMRVARWLFCDQQITWQRLLGRC
jgi:hypothetical protein